MLSTATRAERAVSLTGGRVWAWIAAAAGPIAWACALAVIFGVASQHHAHASTKLLLGIAGAGGGVAAIAMLVGLRELRASRHEPSRTVFQQMQAVGRAAIGLGALSMLLVAALAITVVAIAPGA